MSVSGQSNFRLSNTVTLLTAVFDGSLVFPEPLLSYSNCLKEMELDFELNLILFFPGKRKKNGPALSQRISM